MNDTEINTKPQIRVLSNPKILGAECNAYKLEIGYTLRDTFGILWKVTSEISRDPNDYWGGKGSDYCFVWNKVDESEWTTIEHKPILKHVVDNQWKMGGKTQSPGIINRHLFY